MIPEIALGAIFVIGAAIAVQDVNKPIRAGNSPPPVVARWERVAGYIFLYPLMAIAGGVYAVFCVTAVAACIWLVLAVVSGFLGVKAP